MHCKNCNASNPDANNYCGNCGAPLDAGAITLRDLVEAGQIRAGDSITCKARGEDVEAVVLEDGRVRWGDKTYDTPYEAIAGIRGFRCDSWSCWKGKDSEGKSRPLVTFRSALARARRG